MVDSGGSAAATAGSTMSAYQAFRALSDSADRKFALVRDLPSHARHHRFHHLYKKAFKAYTRIWRFQRDNRHELVEAGLGRWEIGEIASRIGQLYYAQYQRTSESRFLLEAYVFYEAILSRGYFDGAKGKGRGRPDLGLRAKELRFCARFLVVTLLLNRVDVSEKVVEKLRTLLDDCRVSFPGTNFKEWKQILQEMLRFLNAVVDYPTSRPLRYNALFDCHPSSHQIIARFHPPRALRLQDAVLASYRRNEVKFAELTLDTFRMVQSLEWEPSGSFYQKNTTESRINGAYSEHIEQSGGISTPIEIILDADMIDTDLPPNLHKTILFRPSVPHLIAVIATINEELPVDGILLIYISAAGKSDQNIALQKENAGILRMSNLSLSSHTSNQCENSSDNYGGFLCLGSYGTNTLNRFYPADLIPFTRKPLFLIIDSDNSDAFKVIHGAERGETAALFLSPLKPIWRCQSAANTSANGSQFTFFLTAPLQAFCQLVGLSADIDSDMYSNADSILSAALAKWEVLLCMPGRLDIVWAQVLPDPFLRRLILRFIFCRAVLHLYNLPGKGCEHLPDCLPHFPDVVSPDSSSVEPNIILLAKTLGVASQFHFKDAHEKPS